MTALEVLQSIKEDVEAASPRPTIDNLDYEYVFAKADLLNKCPPFGVLNADTWLTFANGSGGAIGNGGEPETQWAIRQIIRGLEPAEIIELLQAQLAENAVDMLEVSDLIGIAVPDIIQLSENAWLYPNDKLPHSKYNEFVFLQRWVGGRMRQTNTAALVQKVRADPVLFQRNDEAGIAAVDRDRQAGWHLRRLYKVVLRRALILQGRGPVELSSTYLAAERDHVLGIDSGFSSSLSAARVSMNFEPDIDLTKSIFRQIMKFRGVESLGLAIDRVGKSRADYDVVNKAVDLGMALEVALMHDDQNAKEEINAKLGLRAGWLLGRTPQERLSVKQQVSKIYSARSSAVHTGRVDNNKFKAEEADVLVVRLIRALLERGRFPEWNLLTFGGDET